MGPYLGHSWSGKWAKLVNLNVLSAVSTKFQNLPQNFLGFLGKKPFFFKPLLGLLWLLFANFWDPRRIFSQFLPEKNQTWFAHMPPVGFSACSAPSNPKLYLWANLYGQMAIFTLSGPPFAPFRPYVGGGKKTPNGLPGCPLLCSSLVSYLSTQNRPSEPKCVAKSPYLAHFLAPLGP